MAEPQRVYCMDLGTGTIDVLLRDPSRLVENQTRFVAPSPALVHMEAVYRTEGPLFVDGWICGGGPFKKALVKHAAKHRTVLHPRVSAIVKNNCEIVRSHGIEISEEIPEGATVLMADELRIEDHLEILARMGEDPPDGFAVAAQDHGGSDDGLPDRVHRFSEFKELLARDPRLEDFAFVHGEVPAPFLRLREAARYLHELGGGRPFVVMDTVFAGLLGCAVSRPIAPGSLVMLVNFGNSHITAALVRDHSVLALFEHHTSKFKRDPDGLIERLTRFAAGVITEEQVREDGGCGSWYREPGTARVVDEVRCSGPRRAVLAGRTFPGGMVAEGAFEGVDPMMVGPMGLAAAYDHRHGGAA